MLFELGGVMPAFSLKPEADVDGTHKIGQIVLVARRLVDRFGSPGEGDGYKVSGEYRFEDAQGRVYTVYDWKETSLFDDGLEEGEESGATTPKEFWGNENPTTFQIGAHEDSNVKAFKTWLSGEVA
jgi:hypothetical protein